MDTKIACTLVSLAGGLLLFGEMKAVATTIDSDIAVSRLGLNSSGSGDDFAYYGTSGGIRAFSLASTACNVGTTTAEWISGSSGNHPVIGQNMYRYLNGRFEQIGQSWLKHSFCAVSEPTCGSCQSTSCSTLGIGCADTYWATLNDGASGGPKSLINPIGLGSGGTHSNHSYPSPAGPTAIRGRLQIHDSDINAGGQNFAEVQYITHDEQLVHRANNASWREVNLSLTSISGVGSGQSSVHFEEPAIKAWQDVDPGVVIVAFTDTARGNFNLGYRVTDNGDGTWHYEYALHNMNSDWGARSFSVPVPAGVTVTNIDFHDVDYHSGEPYSGTDWPVTIGGGQVEWSTQPETENANANALRWGTLYNYRFDADQPPTDADIVIGHFKGTASKTVGAQGPSGPVTLCPTDVNDDGVTNVLDLVDLLLCFGLPAVPGCEAEDVNEDSTVNVLDLIDLLLEFGNACP